MQSSPMNRGRINMRINNIPTKGLRTNTTIGILAAAMSLVLPLAANAALPTQAPIQHVLLVSVDGFHPSDLEHFVALHPHSTLARLARGGIRYADAHTVVPSDSFPGLLALVTGGTPAVTGVYYDETYDHALAAAGSDCNRLGTPVRYTDEVDEPGADGAAKIDPAKLPRDPRRGCAPEYPHDYLRVNTVFEVVHAAGGYTAWADKHPTDEMVAGPSGTGVDDLYLPEIGADFAGQPVATGQPITGSLRRTEAYDEKKARAVLNQIGGLRHDGAASAPVPTVFGLNLQALNVAQKRYGYRDAAGDLTPGVDQALVHTDQLLGNFVAALSRHGLLQQTLVIVTAKHGDAPVSRALLRKVDKARLRQVIDNAAPGALGQLTLDDIGLIWLRDRAATEPIMRALRAHAAELGIQKVSDGKVLDGARFHDARPARLPTVDKQDSRAPDIVIQPREGVIYAKPADPKLVEHGGLHDDDRHVALLLSNPRLADASRIVTAAVSTTQVAPTILAVLKLNPKALQAVTLERTHVLPGLTWKPSDGSTPSQ